MNILPDVLLKLRYVIKLLPDVLLMLRSVIKLPRYVIKKRLEKPITSIQIT